MEDYHKEIKNFMIRVYVVEDRKTTMAKF